VSNCFYSRVRRKGLLYDVERDLLAIAKFLVHFMMKRILYVVLSFSPFYLAKCGIAIDHFRIRPLTISISTR